MLTVITEGNYREELLSLVNTDEDFTGFNGLDYTSEEAIKKGFTSDFDYALSIAEATSKDLFELAGIFIEGFKGNKANQSYYDFIAGDVMRVNGAVVAYLTLYHHG